MRYAIICGGLRAAHLELQVSGSSDDLAWMRRHAVVEQLPNGLYRVDAVFEPDTFARALERAGFVVLDEADRPDQVDSLMAPLLDLVNSEHVGLYPRLSGRDSVRSVLAGRGRWDESAQRWTVPLAEAGDLLTHPAFERSGALEQPHVTQAPRALEPLPGDGTIMSLRGIPLHSVCEFDDAKIEGFAALGFTSAFDVLYARPRNYIETSARAPLSRTPEGSEAAVIGQVTAVSVPPAGSKRPTTVKVRDVVDGTSVEASFFRGAWVARSIHPGDHVVVTGKLGRYRDTLQISNPAMDVISADDAHDPSVAVIGVYAASGKHDITTWDMRRAAKVAAARLPSIYDPVPQRIIDAYRLMDRTQALKAMHAPSSLEQAEAARVRLAFEELLRWQIVIAMARHAERAHPGVVMAAPGELIASMLATKPYPLTGAQARVINEIRCDMADPRPMKRLLMGEVGSGKTSVIAAAIMQAVESGYQSALMVPLDNLAQQHFKEMREEMPDSIRVELLAKGVTGKRRKEIVAGIADGSVDVVIGTGAIISESVTYDNLGLVIVDEQHRFGVEQRNALAMKGASAGQTPDTLVVTATPAPRTAQLTTFGDLDISEIDEMPPGRSPIATSRAESMPWGAITQHVGAGHQVFVITPSVKDSRAKKTLGVETLVEVIKATLPQVRVVGAHGGMKNDERDAALDDFREHRADVLVSTTIVEVGVNVPNATLIVITGAEMLGVTQLHQLRGRVGRGQWAGECAFTTARKWDELPEDTQIRLEAFRLTNRGYDLAKLDLEQRGGGSLAGTHQEGNASDLRVADPLKDTELIEAARTEARALVASDPQLRAYPLLRAEIESFVGKDGMRWLETL